MTCSARRPAPDQSMAERTRNRFGGGVHLRDRLAAYGVSRLRFRAYVSAVLPRGGTVDACQMPSNFADGCSSRKWGPSSNLHTCHHRASLSLLSMLCRMRGCCQSAVRTVVDVLKSLDGSRLLYRTLPRERCSVPNHRRVERTMTSVIHGYLPRWVVGRKHVTLRTIVPMNNSARRKRRRGANKVCA